jgi:glyoxylase-like metal-dependent hydrolase (beta-lactamase superfamily II)
MKNQRKTILALTLALIIALTIVPISVGAKPSNLPKGLKKRIPKNGFIVKEEFGDVIRYREYIPLDASIAQSFPVDPSLLEDLPDHIFYSVNVYAYETDDSVIVIDAGHELLAKKLYACLKSDFGKKPITVLLTHGHADHAGGGSYLQKKGATIWVHPFEYQTVLNGYESPYAPDDFKFTGYSAETYPMEYSPIFFEGLMILYTPGHTQGSVSLYRPEIGSLFTGDITVTLGEHESPSDFTTEVIYGALLSHAAYPESLMAQAYSVDNLPDVNTIYPGHFGPYSGYFVQAVVDATLGAINAILYPVP